MERAFRSTVQFVARFSEPAKFSTLTVWKRYATTPKASAEMWVDCSSKGLWPRA